MIVNDLKLYIRQPEITFSKSFVNLMKENSITITRKNKFIRNGIILNHGNKNPIYFGRKVRRMYLLNNPSAIKYCANKLITATILNQYTPEIFDTEEETLNNLPVIAKPLNGHHGYGITTINTEEELDSFTYNHRINKFIIQKYIPLKHEYRFNVYNNKVYQVSHKERQYDEDGIPLETNNGGMVFKYRSLGKNAGISSKFWDYVYDIIKTIHNEVGNDLAHYAIDVIKGKDKKYYLCELNSASGLGAYTLYKLIERIKESVEDTTIEKYRVI